MTTTAASAVGGAIAVLTVLVAAPSRPRRRNRSGGPASRAAQRIGTERHRVISPRSAARRWAVAMAGAVALVVAPPLLVPIVAGGWMARQRQHARARRAGARAITSSLPDAVDLLLLCTSAGQSLPLAHPRVAGRIAPPLGEALRRAASEADAGRPRAEALVAAMTPLGDRATGLAHALADHLHYGAPLAPTLERWGAELRGDRRRQAEEAARRVPVRLLAPLIACVLPAFVLLTVVPLLVASLRALPT